MNIKFLRNIALNPKINKLSSFHFFIGGCGGLGSNIAELLVRLGVKKLTLLDKDKVDATDRNRLALSNENDIGKSKVKFLKEKLLEIADVNINIIEKDVKELATIEGDIFISSFDNLYARIVLWRKIKELKKPYLFVSAQRTEGQISFFVDRDFEKTFSPSTYGKELPESLKHQTCLGVFPTTIYFASALAVQNIINYVIGERFVKAPEVLFFDIANNSVNIRILEY